MKRLSVLLTSLFLFIFIAACSTDSGGEVVRDQDGVLIWGFSPAVDGIGMVFETNGETYGAPGNRTDYQSYFSDDENRVEITADFVITGEKTVRGWGVEYPAIEFLEIRVR